MPRDKLRARARKALGRIRSRNHGCRRIEFFRAGNKRERRIIMPRRQVSSFAQFPAAVQRPAACAATNDSPFCWSLRQVTEMSPLANALWKRRRTERALQFMRECISNSRDECSRISWSAITQSRLDRILILNSKNLRENSHGICAKMDIRITAD